MSNIQILKRLYRNYTKKFLNKIILSIFFSILVAVSTSAIAYLLDPAIEKIFIEKNKTLMLLIPIAIVLAFTTKGISLYIAKVILVKVGGEIKKMLQFQMMESILNSSVEGIDKKHSGKFISHLSYDTNLIQKLVTDTILLITKDTLTLIGLIGVMFYQNWKLALFAIIMIPLAAGLAKNLGRKMGKATVQASETSGRLVTFLTDIFRLMFFNAVLDALG